MSYKSTNGVKLSSCDSQQWSNSSMMETVVKFAGEDAKDRLYEPKHKKKLIRVLTVIAYVFFVSLAAIMLSLYYVFLWNDSRKVPAKYVTSGPSKQQLLYGGNCDSILAEMQQQFTAMASDDIKLSPSATTTEQSVTLFDEYDSRDRSLEDFQKSSVLIRRLIDKYETNY